MEDDVRAAIDRMAHDMSTGFATLRAEMTADMTARMDAGFARMERYFELSRAQYVKLRTSLHLRIDELLQRMDEFSQRMEARERRRWVDARLHELRQDVDRLSARVSRLEE
jgi:hypothetical protein